MDADSFEIQSFHPAYFIIISFLPPSLCNDTNSYPANAAGLLTTKITESPLKNIFETYRSLFIADPLCFPFPPLEYSVHISFTSSSNLLK